MLVVTVLSFAAGLLLTIAGTEILGLDAKSAYSASILLCTAGNFFACRHYVFRTAASPLLPEALKFFPSVLVFRFFEIALFSFFNNLGLDYRLAYVTTAVISMALKFLVAKFFIFNSPRTRR